MKIPKIKLSFVFKYIRIEQQKKKLDRYAYKSNKILKIALFVCLLLLVIYMCFANFRGITQTIREFRLQRSFCNRSFLYQFNYLVIVTGAQRVFRPCIIIEKQRGFDIMQN